MPLTNLSSPFYQKSAAPWSTFWWFRQSLSKLFGSLHIWSSHCGIHLLLSFCPSDVLGLFVIVPAAPARVFSVQSPLLPEPTSYLPLIWGCMFPSNSWEKGLWLFCESPVLLFFLPFLCWADFYRRALLGCTPCIAIGQWEAMVGDERVGAETTGGTSTGGGEHHTTVLGLRRCTVVKTQFCSCWTLVLPFEFFSFHKKWPIYTSEQLP